MNSALRLGPQVLKAFLEGFGADAFLVVEVMKAGDGLGAGEVAGLDEVENVVENALFVAFLNAFFKTFFTDFVGPTFPFCFEHDLVPFGNVVYVGAEFRVWNHGPVKKGLGNFWTVFLVDPDERGAKKVEKVQVLWDLFGAKNDAGKIFEVIVGAQGDAGFVQENIAKTGQKSSDGGRRGLDEVFNGKGGLPRLIAIVEDDG